MSLQVAKKIVSQRTDALLPYARNSRTHSEEQVAQIAASMREFGFTNPVLVDAGNGIVAGHGRVMAAKLLGLAEVPTINVGWMSEAQRRAYIIADNQIALNAGWDADMLSEELAELNGLEFDLELLGFGADDLAAALGLGGDGDGGGGAKRDEGIAYKEKFAIIVECQDERSQQADFERLQALGYTCKVLVN